MAGGVVARGPILEYMKGHPGQIIRLADLVAATGLPEDAIQKSVRNMKYGSKIPITIESPGQAWSYIPDGATSPVRKRKFTELAVSTGGQIIIEDSKGTIYIAREVL